jgi:uncharacterized protein YqeY
MTLRDRIAGALAEAMKARDAARVSTLRLVNAAIKDKEIALRGEGGGSVGDPEVLAILARMVKQRQESAKVYQDGGRPELADKELAEVGVIEGFLPRQMNADEIAAAIGAAIALTGAASIRDMGRVMAVLKDAHAGQMDFAAVGPMVRQRLG